jgi:hypothetical protein
VRQQRCTPARRRTLRCRRRLAARPSCRRCLLGGRESSSPAGKHICLQAATAAAALNWVAAVLQALSLPGSSAVQVCALHSLHSICALWVWPFGGCQPARSNVCQQGEVDSRIFVSAKRGHPSATARFCNQERVSRRAAART